MSKSKRRQSSELHDTDMVSLVELKMIAERKLKPDSLVRDLILQEPDLLSREAAIAKMSVYSRLLDKELSLKSI